MQKILDLVQAVAAIQIGDAVSGYPDALAFHRAQTLAQGLLEIAAEHDPDAYDAESNDNLPEIIDMLYACLTIEKIR